MASRSASSASGTTRGGAGTKAPTCHRRSSGDAQAARARAADIRSTCTRSESLPTTVNVSRPTPRRAAWRFSSRDCRPVCGPVELAAHARRHVEQVHDREQATRPVPHLAVHQRAGEPGHGLPDLEHVGLPRRPALAARAAEGVRRFGGQPSLDGRRLPQPREVDDAGRQRHVDHHPGLARRGRTTHLVEERQLAGHARDAPPPDGRRKWQPAPLDPHLRTGTRASLWREARRGTLGSPIRPATDPTVPHAPRAATAYVSGDRARRRRPAPRRARRRAGR